MRFVDQHAFRDFDRSVRRSFRFARTAEQTAFLEAVVATSATRVQVLKEGAGLYRAQLGHGWRSEEIAPGEFDDFPAAYDPDRMLPDPDLVGDGRVNARGIACLYLATKRETAALEVRPLSGSFISIAHFRVLRDVRIVDCSERLIGGLVRFGKVDWTDDEVERQVWTDLNDAFSSPAERGAEDLSYLPTQIIAEAFRLQGYDGIAYKSGYEDGCNVALFDIMSAELKKCGLHRVTDMHVDLTEVDNPYYRTTAGTVRNIVTDVRAHSEDES